MTAPTDTAGRPHGYARAQREGCLCRVCRQARRVYDYRRSSAMAAGTWRPWVPAGPVREHLVLLKQAGLGEPRIADVSGVSRRSVASILGRSNRPATKVRPETARRILALDPAVVAPLLVDATGSIRRVQALTCLGWSFRAQERQAGLARTTLRQILRHDQIKQSTAAAIEHMYDRLSMTLAPADRYADQTRAMAAARRWTPPLGWNDHEIDDPAALPAGTPRGGPGQLAAWLANYQVFEARGLSRREIAVRLRTTEPAIKDRLCRARKAGLLPPDGPADGIDRIDNGVAA